LLQNAKTAISDPAQATKCVWVEGGGGMKRVGLKETQQSKIQWIPLLIKVNKIKWTIHEGGGMSDL
jgi:hypothetical protein